MNIIFSIVKTNPYKITLVVFLTIFLFQIFSAFYGFDELDTGFFITGYEHFFEAPESVSQTMGYYLSNVIGGWFLKIFPYIGVWEFRIIGAILLDCIFLMVFLILRNEIPTIHLLLGFILIVLGQSRFPFFVGNGLLSCIFYTIFLLLLYRGISERNKILIFISGFIVGINIFVRIPNVMSISIVLIVLLNRWFIDGNREYDYFSAIVFSSGILVGCLSVFLLIRLLGHQQLMIDTIVNIVKSGNSEAGDNHSWSTLIIVQLYLYSQAVIFLCLFYTIFAIDRKVRDKKNIYLTISFFLIASFVIIYHVYLSESFNPLWALCFAGCLIGLRKQGKLRLLSIFSLFMLLMEPFGSNSGYNQVCLPAILATPIACYFIINQKNIIYVLVACFALGLQFIKQGCYGDLGPIWEKNSLINVQELAHIRTTKEKAEVFNSSLPKLRSLIAQKDTLMVYDAVPLMNYLTHTRPVNGQSWPALNRSAIDLNACVSPPKILIQKFYNISDPLSATHGVPTGNQMVDSYIQEHRYQIVWENPYFILLFPQK